MGPINHIIVSDDKMMKSSSFCKLVWNTKLNKNIKDSAGKHKKQIQKYSSNFGGKLSN